jgi:subtilase family serine protease
MAAASGTAAAAPAGGLLGDLLGAAPIHQLLGAAPLHGPLVNLPCSNPRNHGLAGRVLGAVNPRAGHALRCFAEAVASTTRKGPQLTSGPTGLTPAQIQSAYKLAGLTSGGRTVAVVDAYNDPNAAADLATYRATYGLPACTVASGCFKQINEWGQSSPLPSNDAGWAEEESLDVDAISAACPDCHILLVEAGSAGPSDFARAENAAAAVPGVVAISNSYGGLEDGGELGDDVNFNHPGIAITAASGDSAYTMEWPAASQYVTAAGGTTLTPASNARGWTETAWSSGGSGCSAYEPKPSWQKDTGCAHRTVADVSADANPSTGLGVYDTYNTCGSNFICDLLIELGLVQGVDGWIQVGGTSLASPLIASVYALAGNTGSIHYGNWPYLHAGSLYDVTSGSNGSCSPAYLCTAGAGYDGPTGLGTPDGIGAF